MSTETKESEREEERIEKIWLFAIRPPFLRVEGDGLVMGWKRRGSQMLAQSFAGRIMTAPSMYDGGP